MLGLATTCTRPSRLSCSPNRASTSSDSRSTAFTPTSLESCSSRQALFYSTTSNGFRSTREPTTPASASPRPRLPSRSDCSHPALLSRSGYDFGYLLKLVSCTALPATESEFFELLRIWFPCIWDIKVSHPLGGGGTPSSDLQQLTSSCLSGCST